MVNDDLKVLRDFIYKQGLSEVFQKPTEHAGEGWAHLNNMEIACDLESDECLAWKMYSKKYRYRLASGSMWCSFAYGEVSASSIEEARSKVIEKLKYDFEKANDALNHCDTTKGYNLWFNHDDIKVTEI